MFDDSIVINGQPIIIIQQHGQAEEQSFNNYKQGCLYNNQGFNG